MGFKATPKPDPISKTRLGYLKNAFYAAGCKNAPLLASEEDFKGWAKTQTDSTLLAAFTNLKVVTSKDGVVMKAKTEQSLLKKLVGFQRSATLREHIYAQNSSYEKLVAVLLNGVVEDEFHRTRKPDFWLDQLNIDIGLTDFLTLIERGNYHPNRRVANNLTAVEVWSYCRRQYIEARFSIDNTQSPDFETLQLIFALNPPDSERTANLTSYRSKHELKMIENLQSLEFKATANLKKLKNEKRNLSSQGVPEKILQSKEEERESMRLQKTLFRNLKNLAEGDFELLLEKTKHIGLFATEFDAMFHGVYPNLDRHEWRLVADSINHVYSDHPHLPLGKTVCSTGIPSLQSQFTVVNPYRNGILEFPCALNDTRAICREFGYILLNDNVYTTPNIQKDNLFIDGARLITLEDDEYNEILAKLIFTDICRNLETSGEFVLADQNIVHYDQGGTSFSTIEIEPKLVDTAVTIFLKVYGYTLRSASDFNMKFGDHIVTTSGVFGTFVGPKDDATVKSQLESQGEKFIETFQYVSIDGMAFKKDDIYVAEASFENPDACVAGIQSLKAIVRDSMDFCMIGYNAELAEAREDTQPTLDIKFAKHRELHEDLRSRAQRSLGSEVIVMHGDKERKVLYPYLEDFNAYHIADKLIDAGTSATEIVHSDDLLVPALPHPSERGHWYIGEYMVRVDGRRTPTKGLMFVEDVCAGQAKIMVRSTFGTVGRQDQDPHEFHTCFDKRTCLDLPSNLMEATWEQTSNAFCTLDLPCVAKHCETNKLSFQHLLFSSRSDCPPSWTTDSITRFWKVMSLVRDYYGTLTVIPKGTLDTCPFSKAALPQVSLKKKFVNSSINDNLLEKLQEISGADHIISAVNGHDYENQEQITCHNYGSDDMILLTMRKFSYEQEPVITSPSIPIQTRSANASNQYRFPWRIYDERKLRMDDKKLIGSRVVGFAQNGHRHAGTFTSYSRASNTGTVVDDSGRNFRVIQIEFDNSNRSDRDSRNWRYFHEFDDNDKDRIAKALTNPSTNQVKRFAKYGIVNRSQMDDMIYGGDVIHSPGRTTSFRVGEQVDVSPDGSFWRRGGVVKSLSDGVPLIGFSESADDDMSYPFVRETLGDHYKVSIYNFHDKKLVENIDVKIDPQVSTNSVLNIALSKSDLMKRTEVDVNQEPVLKLPNSTRTMKVTSLQRPAGEIASQLGMDSFVFKIKANEADDMAIEERLPAQVIIRNSPPMLSYLEHFYESYSFKRSAKNYLRDMEVREYRRLSAYSRLGECEAYGASGEMQAWTAYHNHCYIDLVGGPAQMHVANFESWACKVDGVKNKLLSNRVRVMDLLHPALQSENVSRGITSSSLDAASRSLIFTYQKSLYMTDTEVIGREIMTPDAIEFLWDCIEKSDADHYGHGRECVWMLFVPTHRTVPVGIPPTEDLSPVCSHDTEDLIPPPPRPFDVQVARKRKPAEILEGDSKRQKIDAHDDAAST